MSLAPVFVAASRLSPLGACSRLAAIDPCRRRRLAPLASGSTSSSGGKPGVRTIASFVGASVVTLDRRRSLFRKGAGQQRQQSLHSNLAEARAVGAASSNVNAVPVILLSGFLGTGKTTLLRNWLECSAGERIGVIVNDVAAVNIDAKLVKQEWQHNNIETFQLQNGCACCSLGDELMTTIQSLAAMSEEPFSKIVVELSGVAEPKRIREMFERADAGDDEIFSRVTLSKVVTVVDSSSFCKDYMDYKYMEDRPELMESGGNEVAKAKVVELLVEQVEAADIVVLNKLDLADEAELAATRAVLQALNDKVGICSTSYGRLSLAEVLGSVPCSAELAEEKRVHEHGHGHSHDESGSHGDARAHTHAAATRNAHSHSHDDAICVDVNCHDHGHSHSHTSPMSSAEERFGITSFTYRARKPFCVRRLNDLMSKWPKSDKDSLLTFLGEMGMSDTSFGSGASPFENVIRSKGFCWIDSHPSSRLYFNYAGSHLAISYEGLWWGATPDDQLPLATRVKEEEYERARREDWVDFFEDRRQELVFIGVRLDEAAITRVLDECLLLDEEMEKYRTDQVEDAEALAREWRLAARL